MTAHNFITAQHGGTRTIRQDQIALAEARQQYANARNDAERESFAGKIAWAKRNLRHHAVCLALPKSMFLGGDT